MSPGRSSSYIPTTNFCAWGGLSIGLAATLASAQTVEVGVFGLFHPQSFTVRTCSSTPIRAGGRLFEGSESATIIIPTQVTSPMGGPADILLAVPGNIERCYHGTIDIRRSSRGDELTAIVKMDIETAVASIVAAELPVGTPMEALKAQAVAARSFLQASLPRHRDFQFCDTTHCQFLRAVPPPGSAAARAAGLTTGILLTYEGVPFAPQYSAACGGRTISSSGNGYRYQSVRCEYCQRHSGEGVRGHQRGLCQVGAADLAARGIGFREILIHYYPGTAIEDFPTR